MKSTLKVAVTAQAPKSGWRVDQLCSQAEQAERLGFHSFWLPENHFGDQRSVPSPLTLLAAVAGRTQRIKLGSSSYLLPIRDPLLAAEEVAVLDQLSGGRVILGVGRGMQPAMFKAFGIDARDKRSLFKHKLEFMLKAWRGEPIYDDAAATAVYLAPLPLQRPHPPVWVAAFGPLALEQVGKLGLPYLASPIESLDVLSKNYQRHSDVVDAEGAAPVATVPVMRAIFITNKPSLAKHVRLLLERAFPHALRQGEVAVDDWAIVGDRHYARDLLGDYVQRLGITHLIAGAPVQGVASSDSLGSYESLLAIADEL